MTGRRAVVKQVMALRLPARLCRLDAFLHIHLARGDPLPFGRSRLAGGEERGGSRSRSVGIAEGSSHSLLRWTWLGVKLRAHILMALVMHWSLVALSACGEGYLRGFLGEMVVAVVCGQHRCLLMGHGRSMAGTILVDLFLGRYLQSRSDSAFWLVVSSG